MSIRRNIETMDALQQIHDELLKSKPEKASHDADQCPLCAAQIDGTSSPAGGEMSDKQFTQEELDAAVAEALKPIQDELKGLRANASKSEVEANIADLNSQIKELQSQLDAAVLETQKAKQEKADLEAEIAAAKEAEEHAKALAARRDERLAKVGEVASFPDEYMQANADRWAAMSDEDFEAAVSDWKTISVKKAEGEEVDPPRQTAMVASREDKSTSSALRDIFDLKLRGVDPRRV